GVFSIDSDGNWTYVANSAFDELNVGDSLVDVFPIESTDGTIGSVTVTINGTNDLPQFVATDDFVPGGGEGDEQPTAFAFEDGAYSFSFQENTPAGTPIGQVAATDPDNDVLVFSISTNIQNEGGEDLFQIDPDTGEISLTDAGAASFTNDFEQLANSHPIVVTVTEGDGIGEPQSVDVDVTFTELGLNEPPKSDEPDGGYEFTYDENSLITVALGQVSATDLDADDSVTYSITTNVEIDGVPLYRIDEETGEIFLTEAGAAAFTNDFESTPNMHDLKVTATDTGGLTDIINVTMKERDVNERPEAMDFSVDAGTAIFVPIIFDSDDASLDRVSDEDDDSSGTQVLIMLSSLPDSGTLLYIEDGVTRVITESDLISIDDYDMEDPANLAKMFVPNNIVYVPGVGEEFELGTSGDPDGIELVGGFDNWGEPVSDVERVVTLENGNQITVTFVDQNPNGSPNAKLKQYEGTQPHVGYGIADNQGNGLQPGEQIIFNLRSNPLTVVNFGLDGLGGNFAKGSVVLVTYELASGGFVTEEYSKDPSDVGNANIYYEFSYSSPDDPIVGMTFDSTGGSYEIRYLSGNEDVVKDVTFGYVAVDSGLLISEERTVSIDITESPEYQVVTADDSGNVEADIGNQVMLGDSDDNIFVWLDNTLDNGTDVIDNFELGRDLIDLRAILEDDDNVEVGDLIDSIDAVVDGDDVVMTVTDEGRGQTIVLEGVTTAFEDAGLIESNSIVSELEMLNQVLKTDTVT
ncbi:cadherin domain-containing protein, partial [Vibrio sp. M260118]|uniref:cadherin domain-containing protein n=1 Tax=Vibrio sp. M260118 TaxID=3020896 RepID=UPI002F410526